MNSDYYDEELHVNLRNLREVKEISAALDTLIGKIKSTDDYSDCINIVSSFYDMAYRRGYDNGFKDSKNKEEY